MTDNNNPEYLSKQSDKFKNVVAQVEKELKK